MTNADRDEHCRHDGQLMSDGEIHEEKSVLARVRKAPSGDRIEQMRAIVAAHAMMEIDGVIVDVQSANVAVTVYDALTQETNKAKLLAMPVKKLIDTAFKTLARARK